MAPYRWRTLAALVAALFLLLPATQGLAKVVRPQGIGPTSRNPTGIILNLPATTLYWYVDGQIVRVFPIAIGKPSDETPTGNYKVFRKLVNPTWTSPIDGRVVPPGPNNPLGTRWMEWSPSYGIHGNIDPASIGGTGSLGCVRMYTEDVEWLYEQVPIGTPVTVLYEPVQVQYGSDGRRYLAVYPDLYSKGLPLTEKILRNAGIAGDIVSPKGPGLYALDPVATVNGKSIPAFLSRGRAFVAARDLGNALGASVQWNQTDEVVAINGKPVSTELKDGTGYVDAEAAAKQLGLRFDWNGQAGTVQLADQEHKIAPVAPPAASPLPANPPKAVIVQPPAESPLVLSALLKLRVVRGNHSYYSEA